MATKNGTDGRIYGGDCNLIHVADGQRATMGHRMAYELDGLIRLKALNEGRKTPEESATQELCPGCYMVVGFNMLTTLAKKNNQSMKELGLTMAKAFAMLAEQGEAFDMEEIEVLLDPEEIPSYQIAMRD